tara:strand:- start:4108 stop:4446 length:339 start_codon:yes stop_codon:yes gene_type:complete
MYDAHFSVHHGHRRGFSITFQNGYRVSVQFAPSNYCENYSLSTDPVTVREEPNSWNDSSNAEVAVISPNGGFVRMYGNQDDDVLYEVSPDLLSKIIQRVSEFTGVNADAYSC